MLPELKDRLETAVSQQAGAGFTYRECCLLLAAVNCLAHVCEGRVIHVVAGSQADATREESALYARLLREIGLSVPGRA